MQTAQLMTRGDCSCPLDDPLDLQFNFLTHLERRLDIGQDATVSLLGDWLSSYEPGPRTARMLKTLPRTSRDDIAAAA